MSVVNGVTLGKNTLVVINTPQFAGAFNELRLQASVTELTYKETAAVGTIYPINGRPKNWVAPTVGEGTISTVRENTDLEDYWLALSDAYYSGENLLNTSVTIAGFNSDTSSFRYVFSGVVFFDPDWGTYVADAPVMQKIDFRFSQRSRIL